MKKYITKRIIVSIIILLGICIFVFALLQIAPGNPYIDSMKPGMTPEQIEIMLQKKGYYDILPIKFLKWFSSILKFDLGYSMKYGQSVMLLIMEKIPNTLFLTLPSLIIGLYVSIVIGRYIAYYDGFLNKTVDIFSSIGISMPTFLFAILLIKWLAFDFPPL